MNKYYVNSRNIHLSYSKDATTIPSGPHGGKYQNLKPSRKLTENNQAIDQFSLKLHRVIIFSTTPSKHYCSSEIETSRCLEYLECLEYLVVPTVANNSCLNNSQVWVRSYHLTNQQTIEELLQQQNTTMVGLFNIVCHRLAEVESLSLFTFFFCFCFCLRLLQLQYIIVVTTFLRLKQVIVSSFYIHLVL